MDKDAHFIKGGMGRTIVLPLIYIVVSVAVAMLSVVFYSAQQANLHAKAASETQLRFILKDRQSQLEALARDNAYWDDTILNAFYAQNMEWIEGNLGSYLTDSFGISELLIVDNNNKIVVSLKDGRPVTGIQEISGGVESLIIRARESESVSAIVLIDGFPALVGASALTPEWKDSKQVPTPQPVLVLAKRFDATQLAEISKSFGLTGLQLQREGLPRALEASPVVEIRSPNDTGLGHLTWVNNQPGTLVLGFMIKPLVILSFIVFLIVIYLFITPDFNAQRLLVTQRMVSKFYVSLIMKQGTLPLLAILFSALFWIVASWVNLIVFEEGQSMLESIFHADPMGMSMRVLVVFMFVAFSLYAQSLLRRQIIISKDLEEHKNNLESIVKTRTKTLEDEIEIRKNIEDELKEVASTDSLTSLFNRRKFNEIIDFEIEQKRRYGGALCLAMCDIDKFKIINDTYGHDVGDEVLIIISQAMKRLIRKADVIARWGGEEFIFIMPNTDIDAARNASDKLRLLIENIDIETVGTITVSFGVAQFEEEDDKKSLISRADKALYQAKTRGRNCVVVYSDELTECRVSSS